MRYMLDTNTLIYAQKGIQSVLEKLAQKRNEGLSISAITLAELQHGVESSANRDKNALALVKSLSIVDILPFDSTAAAEYGKICAMLRKRGTPIGTMDMLIAAHARSEGLIIVTNNVREFERVDGLKIENWHS